MDKIIQVKESKLIKSGDNSWVEITDHEDKKHRIFKGVKDESGGWHDFDLSIWENSQGKWLKITKEKKGQFWNVIGVEEVKDTFVKEAAKKVQDNTDTARDKSIAFSYVKDYKVAQIKAGVIKEINRAELLSMFTMAELIANWMNGEFIVEPVKKKTEPE